MGDVTWRRQIRLMAIPGVTGVFVLYLLPGVRIIYYMFLDNVFQKNFVGVDNIYRLLFNETFQLAMENTLQILLISLGVILMLALLVVMITTLLWGHLIILDFVLFIPFFIPAAVLAELWGSHTHVLSPRMLLLGMFIVKNAGAIILLLQVGVSAVDKEVIEAAKVDGADRFVIFQYILLPSLPMYLGIATVFIVMQFFGIFRDSYMLFRTSYPPGEVYLLQNYLYNQFHKLNYPLLSTAISMLTGVIISGIVAARGMSRKHSNYGDIYE